MKTEDYNCIFSIFAVLLLVWVIINSLMCVHKLEILESKIERIDRVKQDDNPIIVCDELIDEDNYNQMDWRSYMSVSDSIE